MVIWYNLKIGSYSLKYSPLKAIENSYPYCDKDGNLLTKISGKIEKGYFLNEKGEKLESAFKLINGKPYAKLSKTKEVSNYKEVELKEVEDLLQERVYLVESDLLLKELENSGKALKFAFSNGNGFKVYLAYIYPSKIYDGFLFMSLGTTQISSLITEIIDVKKQKEKFDKIQLTIQGINRATAEQLIKI